MKQLTIYTGSYEQALRAFVTEEAANGRMMAVSEGEREEMFYINCTYAYPHVVMVESFVSLLEHIAVQENPIFRHSAKLKALALELKQTPVHVGNVQKLRRYLREYNELHLEGYTVFRMTEYREKLDMMMYSLIKKLKLTER